MKNCHPAPEADGDVALRDSCQLQPDQSPLTVSVATDRGDHPSVDFLSAATHWFGFGFQVIPIAPASKITAVKWDGWLEGLCPQQIQDYWQRNPDHELGFIVGDDVVVFDADTIEAVTALYVIETRFKLEPVLVVLTSKGQHHYFRRPSGVVVKSDSHSTEQYPDRIDIKTGRALVVLPPSTGKSIVTCTAGSKLELSEVTQDFIDAVYQHNGRTAPSQQSISAPRNFEHCDDLGPNHLSKLKKLLSHLSPDSGYDDWLKTGMALFHETNGSDAGLDLYDSWSSKGKKYKNSNEIEAKWRSFRGASPNPVTIGTLVKLAKDSGADVATILGDVFEVCEFETIYVDAAVPQYTALLPAVITPLNKFFIQDIGELERQAQEQIPILGLVVLAGQATVLYAKPNTGKTLLMISMIMQAITAKVIDPSKLIYIDMDDNSTGLLEKARIAQEFGFQIVADGYNGFEAKSFWKALQQMIESNTAQGCIIVLDTLKKFTNTMDKRESSEFAKLVRQFVMKGGTIVALAHVNKRPGSDGKPVYAGTTDILDDFDCGYTLNIIDENPQSGTKIVEFENIKRRGNVPLTVSYAFSMESGLSYNELLLSVREMSPEDTLMIKYEKDLVSDTPVIDVISSCIKEGVCTKMILAQTAAERAFISRRNALKVIERYTGNDPNLHRWDFVVRDRGAKTYVLLDRHTDQPSNLVALDG